MKLTILPEGPLAFDGESYSYSKGERKYIDDLAQYFSEVTICAYALYKGDIGYDASAHFCFKSPNIKILELPLCRKAGAGILSKILQYINVGKVIMRNIGDWELIYLLLPGYPSATTFLINKIFNKPYFVYIAGDWANNASPLFRRGGLRKKLFYWTYSIFDKWVEKKIVEGAFLTLTAGRTLCEKHKTCGKPIYETVPRMTLSEEDFFFRDDTCKSTPVELLFAGDLIPYKGLRYLIEAISMLEERRKSQIILKIVGTGVQRDELIDLVEEMGLSDRIKFLGYISGESELLNIYRDSDIFTFPSLTEGFPRVLYEAMSQSLPIITTDVGGIPRLMKNEWNAILVPPKSPESIVKAINRLIDDKHLRQKLIRNGQKTIRPILSKTAGKQVDEMLTKHLPTYRRWTKERMR